MITTVIPTFERPVMLRRAIESALAQKVQGHQVCIHDNASQDETALVVAEYTKKDSRVKYFRNSENIGSIRNILKGICAVETEYYSLLSDDDFILDGFYERALIAFDENPTAALVCTKTLVVDTMNQRVEFRNRDWGAGLYEPSLVNSQKMYGSHFVTTGVLFNRKVKAKLGDFDTTGSDSLYMTLAAATFPFFVLDQYGGAVTLHESAYSIVGGGIAKESISKLYDGFVISLDAVINSELPVETKVGLTMSVVNAYQNLFDSKKLAHLFKGVDEPLIGQLARLPSLISNRGVVIRMFNSAPSFLKPFVKYSYEKLAGLNKKRANSKFRGWWVPISDETTKLLSSYERDVSKLKFDPPSE